ncbi:hypothetical protein [Streptomyces sp. NPDC007007]|uniref:hypothetical protein n=1 Tax=Streptomyces sp. NPDC007007 TaxID=3364770 RepID=UPI0036B87543
MAGDSKPPAQQWGRRLVAPALVLLALLFIVLGRIDAALGRIEAPDSPSATWGSLLAWDVRSEQTRADAYTAWCVWFNALPDTSAAAAGRVPQADPGPGPRVEECVNAFAKSPRPAVAPQAGGAEARQLIRWHFKLDLVMVMLYLCLLYLALAALRMRIPADPPDPEPNDPATATLRWATKPSRVWVLIGALGLAEGAENTGQLLLTRTGLEPGTVSSLHELVGWAALAKWGFVALALLLLIVLTVHTRVAQGAPWQELAGLRLQIGASALLLILVAGAGIEQVPDALLGLLDHRGPFIATPVAVFLLTLLMWRSVYRAAVAEGDVRGPIPQRLMLLAAVACGGLSFAPHLGNLRALAVVLGFVFLLSWIGGAPFFRSHLIWVSRYLVTHGGDR